MSKRNFLISVLVVLVQYYDYHLFGFLAANIAIHFFPSDQIIVQLLNTYLVMSIAMIAKPSGAIILGKIGDTRGRSNSFIISLIGTSLASLALFMVPAYEAIGVLSTFMLLIARMAICAFVSSGSDGVRIYVYEHLDKSRQCLGIGITTIFTQTGSLIASLSVWLFSSNILPSCYWRLAFLFGSLMGLTVLLIIRLAGFTDTVKVADSGEFEQYKRLSTWKIIGDNRRLFILCSLLAGAIGSTNQFILIFFGTFNFKILQTIDQGTMQTYISIGIIIYMILSFVAGYLADKLGRYNLTLFGAAGAVIFSLMQIVVLANQVMSPTLYLLLVASLPFITMPAAAIFKESIPVSIRYRIFSLSHAVGSILISAPTAFICTWIYQKTNITWLPISYFIITILMISLALYKLQQRIREYQ